MAETTELHDRREELQAWYFGSLQPKLVRAAHAETVAPAAVAELDRLLHDLLRLEQGVEEAA